jgi:hypothetical protein
MPLGQNSKPLQILPIYLIKSAQFELGGPSHE